LPQILGASDEHLCVGEAPAGGRIQTANAVIPLACASRVAVCTRRPGILATR